MPGIVILGGGTAGWMAACLMAHTWPEAAITVVESPEIGIVGVGEGSTPQLRVLFATLGMADDEWMPACHATYKTGIEFRGWSTAAGHERYFHPFPSEIDCHTEPAFHAAHRARRRGLDVGAHPDRFFLNARLAADLRAPLPGEAFPFDAGYGYHFDAHRVGAVLREQAIARGVCHLQRRVSAVDVDATGSVRRLICDGGDALAGDLFVDCSGFRGVIVQEALGVPFRSFADNLFNDRAVVMPSEAVADPLPQTTATALSTGWAWHIPLTGRVGNGYVYSSRYIDRDAAEAELRAHVGDAGEARHLTMKVGRVEDSWRGNCLALGLAQGFLEPLEATALHLVQTTITAFIGAWTDGGFTPRHRDAFNAAIARRYEGIRDYIVAHYRMNRRADTEYWRDNAAHDRLTDDLKALMTCWFTGGDLVAEVDRLGIGGFYTPMSWACLFAGYGTFPARLRSAVGHDDGIDDFLRRCALNFPPHREVLARMAG